MAKKWKGNNQIYNKGQKASKMGEFDDWADAVEAAIPAFNAELKKDHINTYSKAV